MINSLSVIVPVYNELHNLKEYLFELHTLLKKEIDKFEIIIVDSGSNDGTSEFLKVVKKKINIKILYQKKKEGWGSACKYALKYVEMKYCLFFPADNQYNMNDIINICKENQGTIVTYRKDAYLDMGKFIRSAIYKMLCRTLFRISFIDINSIKILEIDNFLNKEEFNKLSDDWLFDLDLLLLIKKNKIKYIQKSIKITTRKHGVSNITFSVSIKMFFNLFALYFANRF